MPAALQEWLQPDHLEALGGLFLQVLALCQRAGLVKLGHVALDGTKVKANTSRNKSMNYGRTKDKEAQLRSDVAKLLQRARPGEGGTSSRLTTARRWWTVSARSS